MSNLLDIGCLFLIALIISCICSKGYLRYFLIVLTIIYYLIGSGILGYFLAKPIQSETSDIKACASTNGIIMLGAGLNNAFGELEPSLGSYDRILKTAEIYNKYPQKIIVTGGIPKGEKISEAEIYTKELNKLGIPSSDILLEKKSKNTYQNAKYTKELLEKDKTYCLVTGGIHYKRAKILFDKFNINTISLASSKLVPDIKILPSAYNFYITQRIIHEYFGIIRTYF
ncbi:MULTISPECIES: YdcF family protein [unclassified Francisella]|uniref:YdcF family protein n=1 Tax=unclassified Francisella TaxID=2610885 RepID=UPI002E3592EC|nr:MULTISPECIES: YdcF family protein [unclassified Francisella]MED7818481.1 YdcF family protein [Francisella sp. 19S2-4]MED7829264.1 YdcF family protein [Francisella sp. 19S2-10]